MSRCPQQQWDPSILKFKKIVTPVKCFNQNNNEPVNKPTGDNICYTACDTYLYIVNYELTTSDIAAGYIVLPIPADPLYKDQCMMFVENGPVLLPPLAYNIVDKPIPNIFNRLEWIDCDLHGLLEAGELIRIQYVRHIK